MRLEPQRESLLSSVPQLVLINHPAFAFATQTSSNSVHIITGAQYRQLFPKIRVVIYDSGVLHCPSPCVFTLTVCGE
jgi:hypothetical protein